LGEKINSWEILIGKPEVYRALERPRYRWNDIKMDLEEIDHEGVEWISLAEDSDHWRALSFHIYLPH
jgi:hypothetical protein